MFSLFKRGKGVHPDAVSAITGTDRSVVVVYANAAGKSSILAALGETGAKSKLENLEKWKLDEDYLLLERSEVSPAWC